jgi:hypothetical protein
MKKQNNILWVLMVLMIVVGNMKGNAQQKSLRDIFDHVIYTGEPIASSELVERGLPGDFYSAKKAVDGKVSKVSQGKENFYGKNIESKILKDIVQNRRKSWEK